MAVSIDYYIYSYGQLISTYSFQGRRRGRDLTVKVEPKSPGDSAPGKRKMYSTTDGKAIGRFNAVDNFAQGSSKRLKTASGSSARVWFNSVMLPKGQAPARVTRNSTRSTKANSKKSMSELFAQLGREYQDIAKTCEAMSEVCD